ncbi:MAG TPA: hypothetical protein VIV60_15825 [Polyangiaceae bacterium]
MASAFVELRQLLNELFNPKEFKNILEESDDFEFLSSQLPLKCDSRCEFWRSAVILLRHHGLCHSKQFYDFLTTARPRHRAKIEAVRARFFAGAPDGEPKQPEQESDSRPSEHTLVGFQRPFVPPQPMPPRGTWSAPVALLVLLVPLGTAMWTLRSRPDIILLLVIFTAAAAVNCAFAKREQPLDLRWWFFRLNTGSLSAAIALIALFALVGKLFLDEEPTPAVTPNLPVIAPPKTSGAEAKPEAKPEVRRTPPRVLPDGAQAKGPVSDAGANKPRPRPPSKPAVQQVTGAPASASEPNPVPTATSPIPSVQKAAGEAEGPANTQLNPTSPEPPHVWQHNAAVLLPIAKAKHNALYLMPLRKPNAPKHFVPLEDREVAEPMRP